MDDFDHSSAGLTKKKSTKGAKSKSKSPSKARSPSKSPKKSKKPILKPPPSPRGKQHNEMIFKGEKIIIIILKNRDRRNLVHTGLISSSEYQFFCLYDMNFF